MCSLSNDCHMQSSRKTSGLLDKTAKFKKCMANFVSLLNSMSDEKLIQTNDLVYNG